MVKACDESARCQHVDADDNRYGQRCCNTGVVEQDVDAFGESVNRVVDRERIGLGRRE